MKWLLCLSLVLFAAATTQQEYEDAFVSFMQKYSKSYLPDEIFARFEIFKQHYDEVEKHNAGNFTWTIGINQFSDLTRQEFKNTYLRYDPLPRSGGGRRMTVEELKALNKGPQAYPSGSLDWSAKGVVTPVKDQGQCGSCWTFGTTGGVEGVVALKKGHLTSLSEQELVDCGSEFGGAGCNGGSNDIGFKFASTYGLCTEAAYPYTAKDGTCKRTSCAQSADSQIRTWNHVAQGDAGLGAGVDLQPISIGIDADYWGSYTGGVFCGSCGTARDHAMLVVGYGTDTTGVPYWKVKNSWGTGWGEGGYIRLCRSKTDECGVSDDGTYPTY
jgi:C1A family cysteine protease